MSSPTFWSEREPTFLSEVDKKDGAYLEHIYVRSPRSESSGLVAVIYETIDGRHKFSSRYKLLPSESYTTVADAKHDLFVHLEYAIRKHGF